MEEQSFQELELTRIGRCPFQMRRKFDIKELIQSVAAKGVLEPILVRPVEPYQESGDFPTAGNMVEYQLVAGERRFRARCEVAVRNGGIEAARIPAMVRVLSDDDAFDIATIENLHRQDLNELEEAEGFKAFAAVRKVLLDPGFQGRGAVAAYLGADLQRDYRLNKDYLEKKTIAEIHALAQWFGLWRRDSAQVFLTDVLKKKPGQFHTCKKDELIRIILESGMDLAGVVPGEILGKAK